MPTTMKLIGKTTVGSGGAASIEFTSIPGTHTDLLVTLSGRSTATGTDMEVYVKVNGSTTSYSYRLLFGSGSSAGSTSASSYPPGLITGSSATASTFGSMELYVPNYAGSTNKSMSITAAGESNTGTVYIYAVAGLWSNTSAITSVTLTPFSGNFAQHSSAQIYGITKA